MRNVILFSFKHRDLRRHDRECVILTNRIAWNKRSRKEVSPDVIRVMNLCKWDWAITYYELLLFFYYLNLY